MSGIYIPGMEMPDGGYRTVEIAFDADGHPMALADGGDVFDVIPAADVQSVKSGEWIIRNSVYLQSGEVMATCSLYNNKLRILGNLSDFNFCPNCGAKMVDDSVESRR